MGAGRRTLKTPPVSGGCDRGKGFKASGAWHRFESPGLKVALLRKDGVQGVEETSLDYSQTMKEKSHRVSRRCYRSGVDALRGTQTRRLDGHTLYSASHVQIRAERQAA